MRNVRFSNWRFGVKRFQAIRHCSVDVARGLVLLFGIGTIVIATGLACRRARSCQGMAWQGRSMP
jgi:hypothetical protein